MGLLFLVMRDDSQPRPCTLHITVKRAQFWKPEEDTMGVQFGATYQHFEQSKHSNRWLKCDLKEKGNQYHQPMLTPIAVIWTGLQFINYGQNSHKFNECCDQCNETFLTSFWGH